MSQNWTNSGLKSLEKCNLGKLQCLPQCFFLFFSNRILRGGTEAACRVKKKIQKALILAVHYFFKFYVSILWIRINSDPFPQYGPENLKMSQPKQLANSNKSISRNFFFDQIPFFCDLINGQKSFFELGKSLKLPKMQFHVKKIDFLI